MSNPGALGVVPMSATNSADGSSVSCDFTYDELDALGQPTGAGRLTTVKEPGRTVKLTYLLSGSGSRAWRTRAVAPTSSRHVTARRE